MKIGTHIRILMLAAISLNTAGYARKLGHSDLIKQAKMIRREQSVIRCAQPLVVGVLSGTGLMVWFSRDWMGCEGLFEKFNAGSGEEYSIQPGKVAIAVSLGAAAGGTAGLFYAHLANRYAATTVNRYLQKYMHLDGYTDLSLEETVFLLAAYHKNQTLLRHYAQNYPNFLHKAGAWQTLCGLYYGTVSHVKISELKEKMGVKNNFPIHHVTNFFNA